VFKQISGVPIVDNVGAFTEILSEKDILKAMFPDVTQIMEGGLKHNYELIESDYKDVLFKSAGNLMTQAVVSVTPDMP